MPKKDTLNFEESILKLEEIINNLEENEVSLEDMLAQYVIGSKIIKELTARLNAAEMKIKQLENGQKVDMETDV